MNPLVIVNLYNDAEMPLVNKLFEKFGNTLRVGTHKEVSFPFVWKFSSMNKFNVEWTRRLLSNFLEETSHDCLIKIDPDTELVSERYV